MRPFPRRRIPPLRPGKRHGCSGKFPTGSAARRGIPVLLCFLLLPLCAVAGSRTTVRVADGVYCVGRGNWGGLKPFSAAPDSNVYLISGIDELALIDTGTGLGVEQILENIWKLGFERSKLKKILLTSAHFDHSGGVNALRRLLPDVEIYAGAPEAKPLGKPNASYLAYSLLPSMPPLQAVQVTHPLQDGDRIQVGRVRLTAHLVPGHTPGATVYLAEVAGRKILFTGDTAIGDQPLGKGIVGMLDAHWKSNVADLDAGLRRLVHLNAEMMLPGHGRWFKGRRRVQENLQHCRWRLNDLLRIPDLETLLRVGEAPDPFENSARVGHSQ